MVGESSVGKTPGAMALRIPAQREPDHALSDGPRRPSRGLHQRGRTLARQGADRAKPKGKARSRSRNLSLRTGFLGSDAARRRRARIRERIGEKPAMTEPVNLFAPEVRRDPYPTYARLRR